MTTSKSHYLNNFKHQEKEMGGSEIKLVPLCNAERHNLETYKYRIFPA